MSKITDKTKPKGSHKPTQAVGKEDQIIRSFPDRVIEYKRMQVKTLYPNKKNWRTHGEQQRAALRGVMSKVGFVGSVLTFQDAGREVLIDGHLRVDELDPEDYVWVGRTDLNREEADYILATLDPIGALAGADAVLLGSLLETIDAENDAVAALLSSVAASAGVVFPINEDFVPPPVQEIPVDDPVERLLAKWQTAEGQLWEVASATVPNGVHRLLCGDSTDAAHVGAVLSVASEPGAGGLRLARVPVLPMLMVTDPPYGVKYDPAWREGAGLGLSNAKGAVLNDDRAEWTEAYVLSQAQVAYVWHGSLHTVAVAANLQEAGYDLVSHIIWAKQHFALSRGDYHWQHEPCWYAVKRGANHNWQGSRNQATLWHIQNNNSFGNANPEERFGHGTQKPIECMARAIQNNTAVNQLVYDPFLGTGTTLVAAEQLGRLGAGLELSPGYLAVCLERLARLGLEPRLVASGIERSKPPAVVVEDDGTDDIPDLPTCPVTVPGDVWCLGAHRLICGDATDPATVEALMLTDRARLCFTSPPYGQQRAYTSGGISDWDALMRGVFTQLPMTEDGQVLVNLGLIHKENEYLPYWEAWIESMRTAGWRRFAWYCWDQGPGMPGDWHGRLAPAFEFVFHFNRQALRPNKTVVCKHAGSVEHGNGEGGHRLKDSSVKGWSQGATPTQATRVPDAVIRVQRHCGRIGAGIDHPAVFPVALPRFVIESYTQPGDVVFEPFAGSGTSMLAAQKLGRICRAIELSPQYVDVAITRFAQNFPDLACTLLATGQTFEQVRTERAPRPRARRSRT